MQFSTPKIERKTKSMEVLYIKGSDTTPEINFNNLTGEFTMVGKAIPADAEEFFKPILNWLGDYVTASAAQTYTVSGSNLTANINITAPANFELSTNGTNYFDSLSLIPTSGSVSNTSIFVRVKATAPSGIYSASIKLLQKYVCS